MLAVAFVLHRRSNRREERSIEQVAEDEEDEEIERYRAYVDALDGGYDAAQLAVLAQGVHHIGRCIHAFHCLHATGHLLHEGGRVGITYELRGYEAHAYAYEHAGKEYPEKELGEGHGSYSYDFAEHQLGGTHGTDEHLNHPAGFLFYYGGHHHSSEHSDKEEDNDAEHH